MKKLLSLLLILIVACMPFIAVDAKKTTTTSTDKAPIKVYVFYGDGCPHCEELLTYEKTTLRNDKEVSKMYELVKLEVWYDDTNSLLMQNVATYLKTTASGVPFMVIGEKYFSGYSSSSNESIKNAIKEAYNNSNYKDIVASVNKGELNSETTENKNNTAVIIITLAITALIIILVIFSRTSTGDAYVEVTDEEDETPVITEAIAKKEEVKETTETKKTTTMKAPAKKTAAKKTTTSKTPAKKAATASKATAKKATTTKKTTAKKTTTKKTK